MVGLIHHKDFRSLQDFVLPDGDMVIYTQIAHTQSVVA